MNYKILIWVDIDLPGTNENTTFEEVKKKVEYMSDTEVAKAAFGYGNVEKVEDCD